MRILTLLAAVFMGLVAMAPGSRAATINLAVSFTATGFAAGAPVDPVTGSFHLSFDPTKIYVADSHAVTDLSLNINFSDTLLFTYAPILGGSIGGANLGALVVGKGTDDFRLVVSPLLHLTAFTYSQIGLGKNYSTTHMTFNVTPIAATPIPASLVMLLTALGTLGGAGYLRGRKAQAGTAMLAA